MKLVVVGVLGFAAGLALGMRYAAHTAIDMLHQQVRSGATCQRTLAYVSVHSLDELQNEHVAEAKSFLAKQVAIYYHTLQQLDPSPEKKDLLSHIEASSRSSPELRQALSTKP
jgi:hypothetical protein